MLSGVVYVILLLSGLLTFFVGTHNGFTIKERLSFSVSAIFILISLTSYYFIFRDIFDFVNDEADAKSVGKAKMWLVMIGKTLLYLFVPAAIITGALIGTALYIANPN